MKHAASQPDKAVLIIKKTKKLGQRFVDIMSAVAFAVENEHLPARPLARSSDDAKAYPGMVEQFRTLGIEAGMTTTHGDLGPAISTALGNSRAVDLVILSPSITRDGNVSAKELQRLVRTASRPVDVKQVGVVRTLPTMAKNSGALYVLLSIVMALGAGSGVGQIFRKDGAGN